MKQSVFIPGQLPGMNEIIRTAAGAGGSCTNYSKLKKALNLELWAVIKQARLVRPARAVRVAFHWREPNRRRDLDNIAAGKKFVLDALVDANVLEDDGWLFVVGLADMFSVVDRKHVGVLVELEEI